jgi:5-methylcytosine-specific restriction endonuclease McrA
MSSISSTLARRVAERAGFRCEYCRSPQAITGQTFHADHIVPRAKSGLTVLDNLCLACPRCNLHKQDRMSGIDPRTRRRVALFHPRQDDWDTHFRWSINYIRLIGRTATGRATISTLQLNGVVLMRARRMWVLLKLLP